MGVREGGGGGSVHHAQKIVNYTIDHLLQKVFSVVVDREESLVYEFGGMDYLTLEYLEESRSTKAAKGSNKEIYKKGKHCKFEYEMTYVCRRHQEVFKFLGLSLRKGFRKQLESPQS